MPPRGSKKDEAPVKKTRQPKKQVQESDESDFEEEILEEEVVPKRGKKATVAVAPAKPAKKSTRKARPVSEDEDELTELDEEDLVDEVEEHHEEEEQHSQQNHQQGQAQRGFNGGNGNGDRNGGNNQREHTERQPIPRVNVNPAIAIGKLGIPDILNHLINVGTDTLNPQLKYGAINLLNQLTGKARPRFDNNRRGGFNGGRGGRGAFGGDRNGGNGGNRDRQQRDGGAEQEMYPNANRNRATNVSE